MNLAPVENIVNAVLYEGYMLYPYRPSSVKNRQRWTFGGVCPQSYSQAQGGADAWTMQTECLVVADQNTKLDVKVRFLHLTAREVREMDQPLPALPDNVEAASHPVESLQVGGKLFQTWQEAVERDTGVESQALTALMNQPQQIEFAFPPQRTLESLHAPSGEIVGVIAREQQQIGGCVLLSAERLEDGLFKVTVRIENRTPWEAGALSQSRDDALMRSLVSTHTILGVQEGEFVSLLEPSAQFGEAIAACNNVGTWPVLVGEEGERNMMLSSPIILYDYPQIAPESPGSLFDGTEIDEILTLRIMTLTDEEKREMIAVDDRARAILDRTEALTGEDLMKLHGVVRSLQVRTNDHAKRET